MLGWDDRWEAARREVDAAGAWQPVRIVAEHRGAYHALADADGGVAGPAWVELTGKAFHAAGDKRALPSVGDWVLVERWDAAVAGTGAAVVRAMLPRRTFLVRRAAGEATAPQPLAANVDVGLVLTSANTDLSPARLDRYLGLLRDGGIEPVLVASKIDLVPDAAPVLAELARVLARSDESDRAAAPEAMRRSIAGRIIALSSTRGEGLAELHALVPAGATAVLLGSSGVGKSTLLNTLIGTAQPTRDLRADERGRHTTTRRELFVAPDGGLWIDTPGMRELAQWADAPDEAAFDDVVELAAGCRFRDCRHAEEPGCAVRGRVSPERLASFHKLAAERAAAAAKQAEAQRIATGRRAKKKPAPRE